MEVIMLDKNFQSVAIIDMFESLIWTDRYDESGDFELRLPMSSDAFNSIQQDYYLWNANSEHLMIIEEKEIETSVESGDFLIIRGRSLEQILDRRVVMEEKTFEGGIQPLIKELISENVISPSIAARRIDNFIFVESEDEKILNIEIDVQYKGEDLYTIISTLCQEHGIGFKITFNELNQFVFQLYAGVDRSYEQILNPYVMFSKDFDNLISSNYVESKKTWKNVAFVVGTDASESESDEETETYTTHTVHTIDFGTGIDRREVYVDAGSLTYDSMEQYNALLKQKGIDALIENVATEVFESEIDGTTTFMYGEDFFVGDIVQIVNEYGQEGRVYISEFVMSHDTSGETMYPTFKAIQKGVYESDE